MNLLHRTIGSPGLFGIEFEVKCDLSVPANTWWGTFWLWADGKCVGDRNEMEMVSLGLGILLNAVRKADSRKSNLLSSLPAAEALNLVMSAVYGDDDPRRQELGSPSDLGVFEVLPGGGPFFDDWQAILLEEGGKERFIWRKDGEQTFEVRWELGTFRNVVLQAEAELNWMRKQSASDGVVQ